MQSGLCGLDERMRARHLHGVEAIQETELSATEFLGEEQMSGTRPFRGANPVLEVVSRIHSHLLPQNDGSVRNPHHTHNTNTQTDQAHTRFSTAGISSVQQQIHRRGR